MTDECNTCWSYSILGMNLFGGKFCATPDERQCSCDEISADINCDCKRKNFDTLLWAIVTVFQVRLLCMLHTVLKNIVNLAFILGTPKCPKRGQFCACCKPLKCTRLIARMMMPLCETIILYLSVESFVLLVI